MKSDARLENEKELLLLTSAGDEASFTKLFNHYRPNVYTTALRITGDAGVAEEILQDTFLKVWLKKHSLGEIENFGGWLYTIAANLTYNAIKKLQKERLRVAQLDEHISLAIAETIDDAFEDKQYRQILNSAVERLPEKQQQTYKLIKQQGLKREEAAKTLKVSQETVKWNLDQAMRNIRAYCLTRLDGLPALLAFLALLKKYL